MLPVIICRHHDVEWINSHTCRCRDCGKQGQWTEQGFAIWIRTEPRADTIRVREVTRHLTAKVA